MSIFKHKTLDQLNEELAIVLADRGPVYDENGEPTTYYKMLDLKRTRKIMGEIAKAKKRENQR